MEAPHVANGHFSVSTDALYHRLHDEGVILDMRTERYFGLNQTGAFVWEALARNDSTTKIAKDMSDHFGISLDDAHRDVTTLTDELERNGLIKRLQP